MAWFKTGGGGGGTMELIGSKTIASTSRTNLTLDKPLSDYKYIFISQEPQPNAALNFGYVGYVFITPNTLVSGNILLPWLSGSAGAITARSTVISYVSDTEISFTADYTASRTYYVYGIK